ncbi:37785_t:CDS:2 [Gigaspora margarita]|uniref:37785_t:CDS:1 n=1 Tax=Gigaspora margarita TaxID=4874 RepID=A0ABN7UPM9_GIGMA|nr:37785_t:CDS:2 [Gigaspora margarita]
MALMKPTVILYSDSHPKKLEISQIAIHDLSYVIFVNVTDVVTKGWNGLIDYQIEGACDEWVKFIEIELSKIKRITLSRSKIKSELDETNYKN